MTIKDRVSRLVGRSDDDDSWVFVSYKLCSTFGWELKQLKAQPIPFVLSMIEQMINDSTEPPKSNKVLGA